MPTSLWVAEAWGWGSSGGAKSSWVVNNEKGIARAAFEWVAGARAVGCGEIRKYDSEVATGCARMRK